MVDKYYAFRKMMDFVSEHCEVTDAEMRNYSGEIEINGTDADGSTIRIRVRIEEVETDGN